MSDPTNISRKTGVQVSRCCSPDPAGLAEDNHIKQALAVTPAAASIRAEIAERLVRIQGGFFDMGARKSTFPADLDSPRRRVFVSPFRIAPTTVTNEEFARFVSATGYRTLAQRAGWSFVFHLLLSRPGDWPQSPPGTPWWRRVDGACWHSPEGPGSTLTDRADHPVTHVSWYDAFAYSRWAGVRLATETEWEHAARGGLKHKKFPWGNTFMPGGRPAMNSWQGRFPDETTAEDGNVGTRAARSYAPNGYGLYNMTGNVWEWVQDWFDAPPNQPGPLRDPAGPAEGDRKVQRGGSFLCHVSYCDRYHVHSRMPCYPDSTASNCGFRVAADA